MPFSPMPSRIALIILLYVSSGMSKTVASRPKRHGQKECASENDTMFICSFSFQSIFGSADIPDSTA